jgi:phosphoribosylaminoimidazolecarboxamide formyltransferase/IMP cyclohydrolase
MKSTAIKRALISVADKSGIVEFAKKLHQWKIEIVSTGGTLKTLRDAGVEAMAVSDVTGFPEILNGRVKTLHPKIYAGLLAAAENPEHSEQLTELGIEPINLVVVNLYPFQQTIAQSDTTIDVAIEQIDIGGPTMVRAAAKNFHSKTVVVNPSDYNVVLRELEMNNGTISEQTRFMLARKAFRHTAEYDSAIAAYLASITGDGKRSPFPQMLTLSFPKEHDLRYGENPHQKAAVYGEFGSYFEQLHGKELSFNNIMDIQTAAELCEEFSEPTAVIIKHTNPCGVASAKTIAEAYELALATDPKSAFGGIVCLNRTLGVETANHIDKIFTEVVIAPDFSDEALRLLRKKKDRRLIKQRLHLSEKAGLQIRSIAGGLLVQNPDRYQLRREDLNTITKRQPTESELDALMFAWKIVKHVKSNAIIYAKEKRTIGIGAGQMSRVDSAHIAAEKAKEAGLDLRGSVVASDAFFPFADGLLEAVSVGASAVIQPGGSVRDEEVIQAANEHKIAMVFTGMRHFKH